MRKYIYIALFFLLCAGHASAQFTLVSGTITDFNSLPYSCGTITASLVNNNGISPTLNGVSFTTTTSPVKLGCPTDPSTSRTPGFYQMQLADNTQIKCGISTCATQTTWQFVVNSTGIAPPLGNGPQTCTFAATVSGTSQTVNGTCPALSLPGGGGAIPGGPAVYITAAKPDVQICFTTTCNNGSNAIATAVTEPPFAPGDVGKIIVGSANGNVAANCPPQGTITAFTDAHHVTVSNAATTTSGAGAIAWGTQDDGANIRNAFLASLGKGCLYLPVGAMFAGIPGSDGVNLFADNRVNPSTGEFPDCVIGQGNSVIVPLPGFNYANCFGGNCLFSFANGAVPNVQPNYGFFKDVELFLPGYTLTGTGTTATFVNWQRVTLENIWLWSNSNFSNIGSGFSGQGPNSIFSPIDFQVGVTACGTINGGANGTVTINQGYCQGVSTSLNVGGFLKSFGLQYGATSTANPTVQVGSNWDSWGEVVFAPLGVGADTVRVGTGGTAYFHGGQILGGPGNTFGAIDCNASGANVVIDAGTTINGGGAGGLALRSVAGCNIKIKSPVIVTNYAASLAGNNVSDPAETQTGTCAANAATVTFKLTYQVAPLVSVSVTTSGSTGAQATSTTTTTATIHCNGATDSFVATVIPNPI